MTQTALITVFTRDQTGLIASISGCLYDLGINLGDATFAVLGEGAEFSAVCEVPAQTTLNEIQQALAELPMLAEAEIAVTRFLALPNPRAERPDHPSQSSYGVATGPVWSRGWQKS